MNEPRALLERLFKAAIDAAQPALCLPLHLPAPPKGRTIVIGAGKASAAMAKVLEDHWPGALSGIVVTRYGYAAACRNIEIIEAAHPVPDAASVMAAQRNLQAVRGLSAEDQVVCLISGVVPRCSWPRLKVSRWRTSKPLTGRCSSLAPASAK